MITQEQLKKLLHYCELTGVFTWITATKGTKKGAIAGSNFNGYIKIWINQNQYLAHRLAWLYVYGKFPEKHLDHINGNPGDNKISNLREAVPEQNLSNRGKNSNNKSGYKGVSWNKQIQSWVAVCGVNKKRFYLGSSKCKEAAYKLYCDFAKEHHGEFFHG